MDKLRALTTFVAIADAGSLTGAARALGSSLPAVVRLLAGLEHELGARLFHRTTRRIALTEAGRRYLERCRSLLTLLEEADRELVAEQTEPSGKLRVTAPVFFGTRHVAPVVAAFVRRYPAVSVEVQLFDRVVDLVEEGIDVGVRIGALADSSLVARPAGSMRRLVVAAPSYLAARGTPRHPSELSGHNCITMSRPGRSSWPFLVNGKLREVPVSGNFSINEVAAAVDACASGLGVGAFLAYQVAGLVASGALRVLLEPFETAPRPIHVVYPDARLLPLRTRRFIDFVREQLLGSQRAWEPRAPRRRGGAERASRGVARP